MAQVFPPRNLGVAEKWGRELEVRTLAMESALAGLQQTLDNRGRHTSSQDTLLSQQISELGAALDILSSNQQRIAETVSSGAFSGSTAANAWGATETVPRPEWATRAVVIAGFSTPPSGASWYGEIELITKDSTPGTADIGVSLDAAKAYVGGGVDILSNPRIVEFDSLGTSPVYIRPRGTRGSGSAGTYSFNAVYAVVWS